MLKFQNSLTPLHHCPSNTRASDAPLFILSETQLSAKHQKHFSNWVAPSSYFLLLLLAYTDTILKARWIIQHVNACSNESFITLCAAYAEWEDLAIAMQRLKGGKSGRFKMSRPKSAPRALYRRSATSLFEETPLKLCGLVQQLPPPRSAHDISLNLRGGQ